MFEENNLLLPKDEVGLKPIKRKRKKDLASLPKKDPYDARVDNRIAKAMDRENKNLDSSLKNVMNYLTREERHARRTIDKLITGRLSQISGLMSHTNLQPF